MEISHVTGYGYRESITLSDSGIAECKYYYQLPDGYGSMATRRRKLTPADAEQLAKHMHNHMTEDRDTTDYDDYFGDCPWDAARDMVCGVRRDLGERFSHQTRYDPNKKHDL